MVVFNNALAGAAGQAGGADAGYKIERSLRFNDDDSPSLTKDFTTAGNQQTFTLSVWAKRSTLGKSYASLISNTDSSGLNGLYFSFTGDSLQFSEYGSNSWVWNTSSEGVYRDTSAWYHIVAVVDTNQDTESDRVKVYVNGAQITFATGTTYPSQYHAVKFNDNSLHAVGRQGSNTNTAYMFDGYMADFHFVDGQALAATDFGKYDDNNVWLPKEYTGGFDDWFDNSQTWSNGLVSSTSSFDSGRPAVSAFDGDLNDWANPSSGSGSSLTFTPPSTLTYSSSVEIYTRGGGTHSLNGGTAVSHSANTWTTVATGSGTINSLVVTGTNYPAWAATKVDGKLLIDSTFSLSNNSFHLDFSDNSSDAALGDDSSGNNNDWTVNNLSSATTLGTAKTSISYAIAPSDYPGTSTNDQSSLSFGNTWTVGTALTTGSYIIIDTGGVSDSVDITPYSSDAANSYSNDLINWTTGASSTGSSNYNEGRYYWIQSAPSGYGGSLTLTSASTPDGDSVLDSPTNYDDGTNIGGNYATMNPLSKGSEVYLENGNLDTSVTSSTASWANRKAFSTIGVQSGKWYAEMTVNSFSAMYAAICGNTENIDNSNSIGWQSEGFGYYSGGILVYQQSENTGYTTWSVGDTIGIALDADNLKVKWYLNGTQVGDTAGQTITAGKTWFFAFDSNSAGSASWNFGQRSFAYPPGSTNGPSSDFKALCTQNLDDPTIADGSNYFDTKVYTGNGGGLIIGGNGITYSDLLSASGNFTTAEPAVDAFDGLTSTNAKAASTDAVITFDLSSLNLTGSFEFWASNASSEYSLDGGTTWTSSATSNWTTATSDISGVSNIKFKPSQNTRMKVHAFRNQGTILINSTGDPYNFSPDFVWIKNRDAADTAKEHHALFDQVRGATKVLYSSLNYAEATQTNGLSSFTSDGFNLGSDGKVNKSSDGHVAWAWDAGDSNTTVSAGANGTNLPGTACTYRANPSAGFSIVKVDSPNSTEARVHGLNKKPDLILGKALTDTQEWHIYHSALGRTYYGTFQTSNFASGSDQWGSSEPDSTYFYVKANTGSGANYAGGMIYLTWTAVGGYSAFGSYTGNGLADGPFVFTGFRPAFLLLKDSSSSTSQWLMMDSARDPDNVVEKKLAPNANYEENNTNLGTDSQNTVDFLSNGFKLRSSNGNSNDSNGTFIYAAFAEHPFKTARAR